MTVVTVAATTIIELVEARNERLIGSLTMNSGTQYLAWSRLDLTALGLRG